jgi:hypothetical protein
MTRYAVGGPPVWTLVDESVIDPSTLLEMRAVRVEEQVFPKGDYALRWPDDPPSLIEVNGVPTFHQVFVTVSIGTKANDKRQALSAEYESRFSAGFPCTLDGVGETLQMRDQDKTNWLTFKDACQDGIDDGHGAQTNPQPIRCTSNRLHVVTNDAGKALMKGARAWYGGTMYRQWQLSDAIDTAERNSDAAAVDAIDVTIGWP